MSSPKQNVEKKIAAGLLLFSKEDASSRNEIVAKISAHAERTGEDVPAGRLRIDDEARERLLFYGRQDVGHALLNTITLIEEVDALRRSVRNTQWLIGTLIVGCAILLLR